MNTQFWRTITPVIGEPIPEGAECYRPVPRTVSNMEPGEWTDVHSRGCFTSASLSYRWRVPREVVPLDVAVNVIIDNRKADHCGRLWALNICAKTVDELRELVTAKLREMSEEGTCN